MLIVAMILKTVTVQSSTEHTFMLWFSLIYLTVFSMAIPVMYHSDIKSAALFHIIEAVVSVALVVAFTFMLRQVFFGQGGNLFYIIPILIAAIGDAIILAMRWKEEINWFVLIFIVLSCVIWVVGRILVLFQK
jgi:FlaA1/EpsC-like NDP-sugar epimerase